MQCAPQVFNYSIQRVEILVWKYYTVQEIFDIALIASFVAFDNKYLSGAHIEKLKEEQELEKKLFQQNAEILQETGMGDGSSLLQPGASQAQEGVDEDDNLKMNIKIFRVSPTNKHKAKHTRDTKEDLVEVETQITLEEEAGKYMYNAQSISWKVWWMLEMRVLRMTMVVNR